ncbi:MAG: alpha-L-fucosidase [Ignavibacteriae bacterium]|nr:alpha-L-fucosidase [Ignavibacteriota bacterium]
MKITLAIFLFLISQFNFSQSTGGGELFPNLQTNQKLLQEWQNMKFGMFVHWGPITLRGTEIGWSRGNIVPIEEYDNLYKEFNPVLFNAKDWVTAIKNSGMKYLVIVTKHHDGFSLLPSDFSDYDITSTPYKKDILKELSEECKKQGILFGTYYSIADWHHPHYTTRYGGDPRPVEDSDIDKYILFLQNQVKELIINYNTNILWFDGQWEDAWKHENGMELYKFARDLKNVILINNRVDKGRGESGMTESEKFAGDFGTPEQKIGSFFPNQPWESCITIGTQWSWLPNDNLKSTKECIQTLAQTVGGGGNLLLNIAPMPDGRIEQRQINILNEIGNWLKTNGESIYDTKGGPIKPTNWMASTNKENKIYIHLFKWPDGKLILPEFKNYRISSISILNNNQKLAYKILNQTTEIELPKEPIDENNTVIEIQFDKDISSINPLEIPLNILSGLDGATLKITNPSNPKYSGKGLETLTDKIRGSKSYTDKIWLGFEKSNFEVTIDFGVEKSINKIGAGFLRDQNVWIFLPKSVKIFTSQDNFNFELKDEQNFNSSEKNSNVEIINVKFDLSQKVRYLKIVAENIEVCPDWHKGAGSNSWLFIDEIIVD